MNKKYFIASLPFLIFSTVNTYKCPDISCEDPIGGMICYLHPNTSPVVDTIRLFKCPADQWCNLIDGDYAWVKASRNSLTNSSSKTDSSIY